MEGLGENNQLLSFSYMEVKKNNCTTDIVSYINTKLIDTESKHVAFRHKHTDIFFKLSQKVKYENTILGIHRGSSVENEYFRIKNMSEAICPRAVRFVISKDGRIWSDNTHWTLAYVYKHGVDTKVNDIPLYIVDLRTLKPTIYDFDGVVFDSLADIKNAIIASKEIQSRLDAGWRPENISYKIGKLCQDLETLVENNGNLE